MTTEALKSTSITNLDATPVVQNTVGEGAPGHLRTVNDQVTAVTGKTAGSTYRLCRFPSNAKVKRVRVWIDGSVTTLTADIDIAWSDSTVDGTPVAYQGSIPQLASADNKFYGSAVDLHAITTPTDYVYTPGGAAMNLPMWKNMGYTTDPGGFFDLTLKTTATNSGGPVINGAVDYVV